MVHLGQNIAKLRGMRRITQKEMAIKLKLGQPEYSKIEQKAEIDDDLLKLIADALEVSTDAIKNFSEEAAVNIISSTLTLNDNASTFNNYPAYHFNPVDKLMEVVEDYKKQTEDIRNLYERLLEEKNEIIEMYKKQLNAS